MDGVREYVISATLTGTSATVTSIDVVMGELHAIYLDYTGVPATTVVTFTDSYGRTIFTAPAGNTDVTYYPRPVEHDLAGAAQTSRTKIGLASYLTMAVTLSGAGSVVARVQVVR